MTDMTVIALGVAFFTAIVLLLVILILICRWRLVPSGSVRVEIRNAPDRSFSCGIGDKLLNVLAGQEIYVPSACGGQGTCGQCTLQVLSGGGAYLPVEMTQLNLKQRRGNVRLSCQVPVKDDMVLEIPTEIFNVRKWTCEVVSNRCVATFIKELVLRLPEGEELDFRAGGYIQIESPGKPVDFTDFVIDPEYREDWEKSRLFRFRSDPSEPVVRAYSMANFPGEPGIVMLNVRIAFPPPGEDNIPPGQMSSYLFDLKPGDPVTVSGPYGDFFVRDSDAEMVFVGGGAGMAPMRSMIFDQLQRVQTRRPMTFWYGARSLREIFYEEEFRKLQEQYSNFDFTIALSEPLEEDRWDGPTGFIHDVLYRKYLKDHDSPEDCEYYVCGPPLMLSAVRKLLYDLGVEEENIFYDDFGV